MFSGLIIYSPPLPNPAHKRLASKALTDKLTKADIPDLASCLAQSLEKDQRLVDVVRSWSKLKVEYRDVIFDIVGRSRLESV